MIPTIIIHGALGSGKTTLLKHLLRLPEFTGSFIIENEFASVNVDKVTLSAHHDAEVYDIAGGCICCSLGTELIDALDSLVKRNWTKPLILETTGVANSAQLIKQLLLSLVFIDNFTLHKNIYVIDPLETSARELKDEHSLDVVLSDISIIGKTDLADQESIENIREVLRDLNPDLVITAGVNGKYELLESLLATKSNVEDTIIHHIADIQILDNTLHGMSYSILTDIGPVASKSTIQESIALLQNHPTMIVKRIKGYVSDESGQWWHVEATAHHSNIEPVDQTKQSLIVVIGENISDQEIKNILVTI